MICPKCNSRHTDNSARLSYCKKCTANAAKLTALETTVRSCDKCPLRQTATQPVAGRGSGYAKVLFVGEAPGRNEDIKGTPFIGAAGQILNMLIADTTLTSKSYYITNVVCCRPPANRVPTEEEQAACIPYLKQTVQYIKPKIIVPLGATATASIFGIYNIDHNSRVTMKTTHGILQYTANNYITILPMYHPAALLYDKSLLSVAECDFQLLQQLWAGVSTGV